MKEESKSKVEISVLAYKDGQLAPGSIQVIREVPLTLYLGEREVVTLLYDGENAEELAVGFFFSEGFLDRAEQIERLHFDEKNQTCRLEPKSDAGFFDDLWGKRLVTSGCGKGSVFYHIMDSVAAGRVTVSSTLTVTPEQLGVLAGEVFKPSELYLGTHGVHAAALCSVERMIAFREDIGRHNALDKISGRCLLDQTDGSDKLLFTTGRLTSEVMIKAGRLGCPVVVSRSSATKMALELAGKIGISVIGGARKKSFHCYTGSQRIVSQKSDG